MCVCIQVSVPTLLVHGSEDDIAYAKGSEEMKGLLIGSPSVKLEVESKRSRSRERTRRGGDENDPQEKSYSLQKRSRGEGSWCKHHRDGATASYVFVHEVSAGFSQAKMTASITLLSETCKRVPAVPLGQSFVDLG